MHTNWTTGGYTHELKSRVVSDILLIVIIVIAVVVVIGLIIWAAVTLKAIETQKDIMKNINKDWLKHDWKDPHE